jgi:hypothetical protein
MADVEAGRDLWLAEVLDEALAECRAGRTIHCANWLARYPDLAGQLPALLESLSVLTTGLQCVPEKPPGEE